MFDKINDRLLHFDKTMRKSNIRLSYVTQLLSMLSCTPITKQQLANLIVVIEQTKFSKTYPTFFDSYFTLRTLLNDNGKTSDFLSNPFPIAEEISDRSLNGIQIKPLPQGMLNDEFTDFLIDCHQELMDIYKKLPIIYAISKEQVKKSVHLQELAKDLNENHDDDYAIQDMGRGISLQGISISGDTPPEEKKMRLGEFAGNARAALLAVSQSVYANIGMACNELFPDKDGAVLQYNSGLGTITWRNDNQSLYAEIYCDFPTVLKNDQIYLLDSESKALTGASENDLRKVTLAIRDHLNLPFEPIYSCQARLDLAADKMGILKPYLSSLKITVHCNELQSAQHAVIYTPKNIKKSQTLKEWELHAANSEGSETNITDALQKELENTLSLNNIPVKYIYTLPVASSDTQNPRIEVYAILDNKDNFYLLSQTNGLTMKTKEHMHQALTNQFAGFIPLCVAEAEISKTEKTPKISAFECTFNVENLNSSITDEASLIALADKPIEVGANPANSK